MIRAIVKFNQEISRALVQYLPNIFGSDRNASNDLNSRIEYSVAEIKPQIVLEIGGVDRPLLEKSSSYKYLGMDIDFRPDCNLIYDEFFVQSIEEKFSRGEGLNQDDINTLLLKSQYNHINHLDIKLDEVTANVASLKGEFNELKGEFHGLRGEFKLLEMSVNARFDTFEKNIELKISEAINTNMRWSIGMIALIVTVLKLADMFVK